MFGRRRPVPEITSRNGQIRAAAERVAVNLPIQGTAADILKRAMIDVHAALATAFPGARMILTVHDELLFEAPADEADDVAALVREKMAQRGAAERAARCGRRDWGELEGSEIVRQLAERQSGRGTSLSSGDAMRLTPEPVYFHFSLTSSHSALSCDSAAAR